VPLAQGQNRVGGTNHFMFLLPIGPNLLSRFSRRSLLIRTTGGALVALWLAHLAANCLWLRLDTRPPFWDTAGHAVAALRFAKMACAAEFPGDMPRFLLANMNGYPPLVYQAAAPLAILLRPTADALLGVNALFFVVLLVSTHGIGAELGGTTVTGLLASLVVSFYPILYGLSRHFLLDFPLTAMVALSVWLLLRTEGFQRPVASGLYGLSLGLGILTKWTFVVFTVGPFLVVSIHALLDRPKPTLARIAMALAVAAIAATPWYFRNRVALVDVLGTQGTWASLEGDPAIASLRSWTYYLDALVNQQLLVPFTVFLFIGLGSMLVMGVDSHVWRLLGSWVALPYLVFSSFVNKDVRFTIPYLPAMAVMTALGLARLRHRVLKNGLVVSMIVLGTIQYTGLTFGLSKRLASGSFPSELTVSIGSAPIRVYAESVHIASPPRSEPWPAQAILQKIGDLAQNAHVSEPPKLTVVPNVPCFEPNVFAYFALVEGEPVEVRGVTGIIPVTDARERIISSDFVVTKTGDQGPAWTVQEAESLSQSLRGTSGRLGSRFERVASYGLPDGSTGHLYGRIRRSSMDE